MYDDPNVWNEVIENTQYGSGIEGDRAVGLAIAHVHDRLCEIRDLLAGMQTNQELIRRDLQRQIDDLQETKP